MATKLQREYIKDLAVKKLKEFKEFRELVVSNKIVGADTQTAQENTMDAIIDRITDQQASSIIDILIEKPEPFRDIKYSDTRIKTVINLTDKIDETINDWSFE